MTRWLRTLGLTAVTAACLFAVSAAAQEQAPAAPEPTPKSPANTAPAPGAPRSVKTVPPIKRRSDDFATIRWHLEGMLAHARTGRNYLAQPASVETFEAAGKEIYKAYVRIRDAHGGVLIRIRRHEKNQDPLLTQYEKRIQRARSQLLVAIDQANNGARLKEFRRAKRGLEHLDKSMHNVEFVLAVLP